MNKWFKIIICVMICQMAGILGSIFTTPAIGSWYVNLNKPSFTPPPWLFGPVWITLYTLMGIALYLVLEKSSKKKEIRMPLTIFTIQLVLNSLWSIIFFGMQEKFYSLIEIIILWVTIAFTILSFYKISKKAALMLIPYIVWVTIATFLNYYILILNP